jgi:hypothetical protein
LPEYASDDELTGWWAFQAMFSEDETDALTMNVTLKKNSGLPIRFLTICLLAGAGLCGCGEAKKPWETAYPAKGTITYDGKPLSGALIGLIPESTEVPDSVRPRATSKADGSFQIGTYLSTDGAPEGKYKVIVTHYPIVGPPENPTNGPNDLPAKYGRAETTDLILEVKAPATDFAPLELQKDVKK